MRLSRFFRPSVSSVFSVGTLLALVVALLTAPLGAQTAKSRAALYTEIDTNLPSTTGAITAAVLRAQLKNIVASANNTINADAQPIDADLTAIAALTTTSFGRGLLTEASDATLKTTLALNLVTNTADADKPVSTAQATAIAAAQAASQPLDADLTAIAALTTASYGRSLLTLADAAALRTSAALVIGTNVQAFDAELDAISGISANGLIARTSASTAAARTLTGTAGQITVTNGDGVAGNPTLSLPTALTSINSITSAAASNLTLGTGSFGTALTFASATGAATFSAPVSVFGSTGTEVNFALNQSGVGQWSLRNIATSGDFRLSVGGNDWFSIVRATGAATFTNTLSVSGTTASTSTTTGSLVNAGGFGNAGAIFGGSNLDINNNAIIGVRSASSGGGGQLRIRDDTGTIRWLTGILGTAANTTFSIYDSVNAVSLFDMTSGTLATSGAIFRGTKAATLPTNGALTVGDGSTAATNVSIGAGNINAGGTGTFGGGLYANSFIQALGSSYMNMVGGDPYRFYNNSDSSSFTFDVGSSGGFVTSLILGARNSATGTDAITMRVRSATSATLSSTGLTIPLTTASTSTTTGALQVAGGAGFGGAGYFGSTVSFNNQLVGNRASGGDIAELTGTSMTAGQTINFRFGSRLTSGNSGSWNFTYQGDNDNTNSMGFGYYGVANILTMTRAGATTFSGSARSTSATGGIGYATGAGGAVTQITSRTTGVTLNTVAGAITLFTAAGSATWQSFTVTNSAVAATDTIIVNQRSGTDLYMISVTAVGAGSFRISFATTGGTTSEAPVFNFSVIKAVSS